MFFVIRVDMDQNTDEDGIGIMFSKKSIGIFIKNHTIFLSGVELFVCDLCVIYLISRNTLVQCS